MGTAPTKSRAAGRLAGHARDVRVLEPMKALIFADNGGAYRWRIIAGDGATLTQSGSSTSYEEAEQAAQRVRDGAASARLNRRGREMAGPPLITPTEQPAPSRQPGPAPRYSCPGCGHVLRVSGLGRHRLYFDRPNTLVMNGVCPVCRRGLPGKNGL